METTDPHITLASIGIDIGKEVFILWASAPTDKSLFVGRLSGRHLLRHSKSCRLAWSAWKLASANETMLERIDKRTLSLATQMVARQPVR